MKKVMNVFVVFGLFFSFLPTLRVHASEFEYNHDETTIIETFSLARAPICICGGITQGTGYEYSSWEYYDVPCEHEDNGYDSMKKRTVYYVYTCSSCGTEKKFVSSTEKVLVKCNGY